MSQFAAGAVLTFIMASENGATGDVSKTPRAATTRAKRASHDLVIGVRPLRAPTMVQAAYNRAIRQGRLRVLAVEKLTQSVSSVGTGTRTGTLRS
jgi:hypothetical protein